MYTVHYSIPVEGVDDRGEGEEEEVREEGRLQLQDLQSRGHRKHAK